MSGVSGVKAGRSVPTRLPLALQSSVGMAETSLKRLDDERQTLGLGLGFV